VASVRCPVLGLLASLAACVRAASPAFLSHSGHRGLTISQSRTGRVACGSMVGSPQTFTALGRPETIWARCQVPGTRTARGERNRPRAWVVLSAMRATTTYSGINLVDRHFASRRDVPLTQTELDLVDHLLGVVPVAVNVVPAASIRPSGDSKYS
jgi:hypothetical protein